MSGTTQSGFPYVTDSDVVINTPAYSRALADKLEARKAEVDGQIAAAAPGTHTHPTPALNISQQYAALVTTKGTANYRGDVTVKSGDGYVRLNPSGDGYITAEKAGVGLFSVYANATGSSKLPSGTYLRFRFTREPFGAKGADHTGYLDVEIKAGHNVITAHNWQWTTEAGRKYSVWVDLRREGGPASGSVVIGSRQFKMHNLVLGASTGGGGGGTPALPTGGIIYEADGYRIHEFRESDTFECFAPMTVELLAVAGGGGGGSGRRGGGGGGGGLIHNTSYSVTAAGAYPVVIGAGGASDVSGSDTTVFGLTAIGGGCGGKEGAGTGANGGSGGGGGNSGTFGLGTPGQGYNGWGGSSGGGGGSAGGAAGSATAGPALSLNVTGTAVLYAGGGNGGGSSVGGYGGPDGTGGEYGGGGGNALAGSWGSGGGGGGGYNPGGQGEHGVVVIRYPIP